METLTYIQVILPLKLGWEPWYSTCAEVSPGQRVSVTLANREYIGVIHRTSPAPDVDPSKVYPANGVIEELAPITSRELALWEFISEYYLCTIGEVYRNACPATKTKSEIRGAGALRKRLGSPDIKPIGNSIPPEVRHKPILYVSSSRLEYYENAIGGTDGNVLILVPDFIALEEMEKRLSPVHPDLLVADSRRTPAQRRAIDEALRYGRERKIILGTRSAIFLPLTDLRLIIIDDEQDENFKQDDPAPRYNARDCAMQLALLHGADVILGTASPSLESLYNVACGKFTAEYANLTSPSPDEIIDIEAEFRMRGMTGPFSRKLLSSLAEESGSIVLIRGWEKEEDLKALVSELLPDRQVSILRYREARETDLSASTVAVLQADALISNEDFRADEKAMHLVSALASRCRRLIIQTASPARFDGSANPRKLLQERKEFGFPPFTRLVETRLHGQKNGQQRYFLKKDSSLQELKREIKKNTPADMIIDVDPQ